MTQKKKKVIGRPFKKGQSGNPGGRPAVPEDVREARTLNKIEFERTLNQFLYMERAELELFVELKKGNALESLVASLMLSGMLSGDERKLNLILDRLIGKVEAKIDFTGTVRLEDLVMAANKSEDKE